MPFHALPFLSPCKIYYTFIFVFLTIARGALVSLTLSVQAVAAFYHKFVTVSSTLHLRFITDDVAAPALPFAVFECELRTTVAGCFFWKRLRICIGMPEQLL